MKTDDDKVSRKEVLEHLTRRLWETALNNMDCIMSYDRVCEDIVDNRLKTWIYEVGGKDYESTCRH